MTSINFLSYSFDSAKIQTEEAFALSESPTLIKQSYVLFIFKEGHEVYTVEQYEATAFKVSLSLE